MRIVRDVFRWTGQYGHRLIASIVCELALALVRSVCLSQDEPWLRTWIVLGFVGAAVAYWSMDEADRLRRDIMTHIERTWGYGRYSTTAYALRVDHTVTEFIQQKTRACGAVDQMLMTIIGVGPVLISDTMGCMVLFWQNPVWMTVGALIAAAVWRALEPWHQRIVAAHRVHRDCATTTALHITRDANMLQRGMIDPELMMDRELAVVSSEYWSQRAFSEFVAYKMAGLNLLFLLAPSFQNPVFAVMMLQSLTKSVMRAMNLVSGAHKHSHAYDAFHKFVAELGEPEPEAERLDMVDYHVERVSVRVDRNELVRCARPLRFQPGSCTLIRGASGSGKTSLIDALMARRAGAVLAWGAPANFKHHFSEFHQSIKEDMPFRKISLHALFREASPEVVMPLARACCIVDLLVEMNWTRPITRELSGGEKTRLALVSVLLDCIMHRRAGLVLDEPEQGLDPAMAYTVIDNIRALLPTRIIIVVSHLERAEEFEWSQILHVRAGQVM